MYCKYSANGWCELRKNDCDPTDGDCIAQQAIQKRKNESEERGCGNEEDNCGRTQGNPSGGTEG
ncbi:MAG: hypothetical protein QW561_01220 [Candidatus Aenigmatarchaeota archaeon]